MTGFEGGTRTRRSPELAIPDPFPPKPFKGLIGALLGCYLPPREQWLFLSGRVAQADKPDSSSTHQEKGELRCLASFQDNCSSRGELRPPSPGRRSLRARRRHAQQSCP